MDMGGAPKKSYNSLALSNGLVEKGGMVTKNYPKKAYLENIGKYPFF